jgi:Xaa-Pro aminopeptidase
MARNGYAAMLVLGLVNIRYICGFTGTDGALIVTGKHVVFLTDSRYTCQAQQQVIADEVIEYSDKLKAVSAQLISSVETTSGSVGFEAKLVSVDKYQRLQQVCPRVNFVHADDVLSALRQIKDVDEVASLAKAAQLNCQAMNALLPCIKSGSKESELSLELEILLRKLGGEDKAFDFIVASGTRGAMPHGIASEKKLRNGELVTIDFGTKYQGYYSDETVTFALGEVPQELRKIYAVVLQAHDLAMAGLAVSMPAREIDKIARQFIAQQGYGEYFGHGLGHGVGLEIHESPTISPRSEAMLEAGMVFTIEPGIYIPGLGGVRIEDTVVLTTDGYRCLTKMPKQFHVLA